MTDDKRYRLDELRTTQQAADELGLHWRTVQARALARGLGYILDDRYIFTPDDLAALAVSGKKGPPRKDRTIAN